MDISGISTSLNSQGLVTSSPQRSELQPLGQDRQEIEAPREQIRGARGRRGLALGILQQELRMTLRAQFRARFAMTSPVYAATQQAPTADDIAAETVGAAKQVVADSPTTAAKSLISFRARVQETATYVRETVGDDNADDIDEVARKVDDGIDQLEREVANYRESTASVLAVDTQSKQRSTIQIRTQEGDVVRFSLKRVDSMSASEIAYSDGEMSMTSTEVAVSSRSRMVMKVEGDLNESELAAIRNVFDQAEMIADEFFGGDIGAAFNTAQGFEFDTEQLARVNMRFRMREVSNLTYAESRRAVPIGEPVVAPPQVAAPTEVAAAPVAQPIVVKEAPEVLMPEQPVEEKPVASLDTSALEAFFDTLSAFLRSVGEGFANASAESKVSYHYSESFKLEVLKAVLHTVAPGEVMHAADNAASVIDSIAETPSESA